MKRFQNSCKMRERPQGAYYLVSEITAMHQVIATSLRMIQHDIANLKTVEAIRKLEPIIRSLEDGNPPVHMDGQTGVGTVPG